MVAHKPSRYGGFTLIELMITVVLMGVLAGLAVPSFRSLIAVQRIKNASFDLFSALNYARSEAIKSNGNISLRAGSATGTNTWSTGWRVDDGTNILRSWTVNSNVAVAEASSATVITFSRDGRLTTTPKIEFASSATLSGVNPRCVQVDLSGRPNTQSGACP